MVPPFQTVSAINLIFYSRRVSYNPSPKMGLVWALPLSLAATYRISVDFFSSGYLDVSVPPVRLINLWIQLMIV